MTKSKNKYGKNINRIKKTQRWIYSREFYVSFILFIILILLYRALYDFMDYTSQEEDYKINLEIIIESIQILEEYLLYGEKEENQILDLFCEYNFIDI